MNPNFVIANGDALAVLRTMTSGSVQTCVTSPPYFGLRDYGTAKWEGGRRRCDHIAGMARGDSDRETPGGRGGSFRGGAVQYATVCRKCGARRVDEQVGLERMPEAYVARLVEIFREVRRVLRDDSTLWLNLGDSYATGSGNANIPGGGYRGAHEPDAKRPKWAGPYCQPNRMPLPGLKPKDLCGIPWRVAFALQADGWYLRSDIIWHKPNPMPESVTDRPTKAHEYLFLLAKSARYYYDADAIRERYVQNRAGVVMGRGLQPYSKARGMDRSNSGGYPQSHAGRNRRSVWTIAPRPFKGAHFATFPQALVEPCILAGSAPGSRVLDPFSGAGTTGLVAVANGRSYYVIELNPAFVAMSYERVGLPVRGAARLAA